MPLFPWPALVGLCLSAPAAPSATPQVLLRGLTNPTAVAVSAEGTVYVACASAKDKPGTGSIVRIEAGKAMPFASGLNQPDGVYAHAEGLYVADQQKILKVDREGKVAVLVESSAFPSAPQALGSMDVDEQGTLYVADQRVGGAVYRVDKAGKVSIAIDPKDLPIKSPAGIALDGLSYMLISDAATGKVSRIKLADGGSEEIASNTAGGLAWDKFGHLFIVDPKDGRVGARPRPGVEPVLLAKLSGRLGSPRVDPTSSTLYIPDADGGAVYAVSTAIPGWEVDQSPLPIETAVAFPDLRWTGWKGETDDGKVVQLRPIALTHAGDGSNREFVATQQGVIHVFPNDPKASATKVFLDIQDRVFYSDNENEQGLLGLAFHPDYKKNGEIFVFYTSKKVKTTNIISRFRVSKDDPDRADPLSEEEVLLVTDRPFWNHDGGTVCFGPDGYLYIALGDGGAGNDPFENGQNLKTLLGKVLRIDVNRKDKTHGYAIPADNPFRETQEARPEIFAYGLRNVWRMAFDRKTGKLWAADVGQNLFEEIDILVKGGNYGWNLREALHPFSEKASGSRAKCVDPIWEYHHDIGKSLTGGTVYRGRQLPELDGYYLYGDYVSAKLWALRYDEKKGRVVENRSLRDPNLPIYSFGEDEQGEVYFLTASSTGRGIYQFVRSGKK